MCGDPWCICKHGQYPLSVHDPKPVKRCVLSCVKHESRSVSCFVQVAILARECGLMLELSDISVESLVPAPLRAVVDPAEYMARLPEFDAEMSEKLMSAKADGECLR